MTTVTMTHRSLAGARHAYECSDVHVARQLSRDAHSLAPSSPGPTGLGEDGHNEEQTNYGTTLLLRGGVDGAMISVVVLSVADVVGWAPAFSMQVCALVLLCWGAYSAAREGLEVLTYDTYYKRERQREKWELDNYPEGEVAEMVQLYAKKGLKPEAAQAVIEAMSTSPDFFVDVMMLEELQMSPPMKISASAAGIRVGAGCVSCGAVPPLSFGLAAKLFGAGGAFGPMLFATIVILGYLGSLRALITHRDKLRLAIQTAALMLPVVLLARLVGRHISQAIE